MFCIQSWLTPWLDGLIRIYVLDEPGKAWTSALVEAQSSGFSSDWRFVSNYAPMLVVDLKTPYPQHRNLALSTSVAETPQRMNARERGEYKEVNPGISRQGLVLFWFPK